MSMYLYENRLKSFTSKKRKWPHKASDGYKATPETLSKAGFYFNPSQACPDNVTCYLCHKSMEGWDSTDDPFDEHVIHAPDCPWVICRCVKRKFNDDELPFSWDDEDQLPTSRRMEEARLKTFNNWWPHEGKRGWIGTSKRMAKAGFYYAPTYESIDHVTCMYCEVGLEGWEPKDNPIQEHRRRLPSCPFFAKPPPKSKKGKTAQPIAKRNKKSRNKNNVKSVIQDNIEVIDFTVDSVCNVEEEEVNEQIDDVNINEEKANEEEQLNNVKINEEMDKQINNETNEEVSNSISVNKEDVDEQLDIVEVEFDDQVVKMTNEEDNEQINDVNINEEKTNEEVQLSNVKINEGIDNKTNDEVIDELSNSINVNEEDVGEKLDIAEDVGEQLDISEDVDEQLNIADDVDEQLNIAEDIGEQLEIAEDVGEQLEIAEDVGEQLDFAGDVGEQLDFAGDVDEQLDIAEDVDEQLDIVEDVDEQLDTAEGKFYGQVDNMINGEEIDKPLDNISINDEGIDERVDIAKTIEMKIGEQIDKDKTNEEKIDEPSDSISINEDGIDEQVDISKTTEKDISEQVDMDKTNEEKVDEPSDSISIIEERIDGQVDISESTGKDIGEQIKKNEEEINEPSDSISNINETGVDEKILVGNVRSTEEIDMQVNHIKTDKEEVDEQPNNDYPDNVQARKFVSELIPEPNMALKPFGDQTLIAAINQVKACDDKGNDEQLNNINTYEERIVDNVKTKGKDKLEKFSRNAKSEKDGVTKGDDIGSISSIIKTKVDDNNQSKENKKIIGSRIFNNSVVSEGSRPASYFPLATHTLSFTPRQDISTNQNDEDKPPSFVTPKRKAKKVAAFTVEDYLKSLKETQQMRLREKTNQKIETLLELQKKAKELITSIPII